MKYYAIKNEPSHFFEQDQEIVFIEELTMKSYPEWKAFRSVDDPQGKHIQWLIDEEYYTN